MVASLRFRWVLRVQIQVGSARRRGSDAVLPRSIHHHGRHPLEEGLQQPRDLWWKRCLVKRSGHQLDPSVAGTAVNDIRGVSHPQAWVPSLFDVPLGSAETAHQEVTEARFGAFEVVGRIHRSKNVVAWNVPVEGRHEPLEPSLTNCLEDFSVVHVPDVIRAAARTLRPAVSES